MVRRNPWVTLRRRPIYDNPWITVTERDVVNPGGGTGIYGVVHFKNLAIGVVPIDADGTTYLVGQYRYPLRRYSWEIPEGGGARGIAPLKSAQRELAEETGLHARHWRTVLEMDLSNSVTDERAYIFLAWGLGQHAANPEETEKLTVRRLPFFEAVRMVERGIIRDAMSVAGIQRVQMMALAGKLPRGLSAAVLGKR
jgi:8-oxo-dGTP pyrophosphatase MutT (NUDIX family)